MNMQFVCRIKIIIIITIIVCLNTYVAPAPMILLKPNYLQQGIIGEAHKLICLIVLSSKVRSSSVNLAWNFTSNDSRVAVIPTTISTDDSIGIIYTTVIQFDYLLEEDDKKYICTLTIEQDSAESTFNLEIISKYDSLILYT